MPVTLSRFLSTAVTFFGLTSVAFAQSGPPPAPEGWHMTRGAALIIGPVYEGSETQATNLFPSISFSYRDTFTISPRGAEYKLRPADGVTVTPRLGYGGGRDSIQDGTFFTLAGGEDDHLRGTGSIDGAVQLGLGVEYDVLPMLQLRAGLTQAVGGHSGLRAEAGARLRGRVQPFGPPLFWSVGPSISFANQTYADTFFSITPEQAANSALSTFEASSGLVDHRLGGTLVIPTNETVSLIIDASYRQLTDDFADSPVVTDAGGLNVNIIWVQRTDFGAR
jgi:outer membrane protein